jgi:hypothetical protein
VELKADEEGEGDCLQNSLLVQGVLNLLQLHDLDKEINR